MRRIYIALTSLIIANSTNAQENANNIQTTDSIRPLQEVIIISNYKYNRDKSKTVAKMNLKNIENPQVYNVVTQELLKEQLVTNFNDALKNATGITRLWESTGRNGDGAEFYTLRGFTVQPTMVNGVPALTNTVTDPINTDHIEVIKGPSGTLFGSSLISYGGLINIITKKPHALFSGEIGYNTGTYGMNRLTVDLNLPVSNETAVRINSAYTNEDSFQDAGFSTSYFVAPSIKHKATDKLSFLVNAEIFQNTAARAPMVFLSRYAPISFQNTRLFEKNYKKSFTTNDLTINNQSFSLQAQGIYQWNKNWTSQTILSKSTTKTNGYYQYLWDNSNGNDFTRNVSKANGTFFTTDIQQNFLGDFTIGKMRNRLTLGFDYYHSTIKNAGSGWVTNGIVSLNTGNDTGDLTEAGTANLLTGSFTENTQASQEIFSTYFSNVLNISEKLSIMTSLRLDRFEGNPTQWDAESKAQLYLSPKLGIVYQIIENKISVFGNYMNGFQNIAPRTVANIDGSNPRIKEFDPEKANQIEMGIKTNLYKDIISSTISLYHIKVNNRVMTDPDNANNTIQGGEIVSKGIELSFTTTPTKGLNIITGFSSNNSTITKDTPSTGYLGLRPEEAGPETLINAWANYSFQTGLLKDFSLGIGGNYASKYRTINRTNVGYFDLPEYTVLNTGITYTKQKFTLTVKLNNLTNKKYFTGWSTVTPQRARNLNAALVYKF